MVLGYHMPSPWHLSTSSSAQALALVDGLGQWSEHGAHYSRRTRGSRTFTGIGAEVVLRTDDAVWSVVLQRTPTPRGSGSSRGRVGVAARTPFVWRNNVFRNVGRTHLSSDLIRWAVEDTARHWVNIYGELPSVRMRTEVDVKAVKSRNPGFCYLCAGWERGPLRRGKLILYAPAIDLPALALF